MKKIKMSSIVFASLLVAGSAEFAMAMRVREPGYVTNFNNTAPQELSAAQIAAYNKSQPKPATRSQAVSSHTANFLYQDSYNKSQADAQAQFEAQARQQAPRYIPAPIQNDWVNLSNENTQTQETPQPSVEESSLTIENDSNTQKVAPAENQIIASADATAQQPTLANKAILTTPKRSVPKKSQENINAISKGSIGALAETSMTAAKIIKYNDSITKDLSKKNVSLQQLRTDYLQQAHMTKDSGSQIAFQQKINLIDQRIAELNKPQQAIINSIDTPTQTVQKSGTTEIIHKTANGGYTKTRSNSTGSATMSYTADGKMIPGSLKTIYADGSTAHQVLNPETGTYDTVKVPAYRKTTIKSPAQKINPEQASTQEINNIMNDSSTSAYDKMNLLMTQRESAQPEFQYLYNDAFENAKKLFQDEIIKSVNTAENKSPEYNFISGSLASLWSYGIDAAKSTMKITSSTIKSAIQKIFEQLAPQTPAEITNKIAADISSEAIPTSTDSTEIKASWIARTAQRIYDAIFGPTKAPKVSTSEEIEINALAQKHQDSAQLIQNEFDNQTQSKADIINMVEMIVDEVRPNLPANTRTDIVDSILTNNRDFRIMTSAQVKSDAFMFPEVGLWQNDTLQPRPFDPAKFNTWMTKTVKLINEKAPAASPAVESSVISSTGGPAQTTGDLQIVV